MLSVNRYEKSYIDGCRAKVDATLGAYRKAVAKAAKKDREEFEPLLFNDLVLVLDHLFMHRARGLEGKDGNPVNEVRMLSDSLLNDGGSFTAVKSIKYKPGNSVLKLDFGETIELSEADFVALSEAYFIEIEARFG